MCYNSGGYVLQPSAALPEGEAQKVKEAAITHSPHAFVPKKELTEEERRERYRTRIDESIRPYTLAHEGAHHYLDRFFFLLQNISRCQNNHQGIALHVDIVIQRKICFVPVCTQKRSCISQLKFPEKVSHFVRHLNNNVLCIERVIFPQIDFFHGNPPISIFEWVNGQIEIRGAAIYTAQVRQQACPAPYL